MTLDTAALVSVVALPAIGALFSLLMPSDDRLALRQIAMTMMIASGLVALWLASEAFVAPVHGVAFGVAARVDGLSGLVLASLGVGAPIALRAGAPRVQERSQFYVATMLFAHALLAGAVVVEVPLLRVSLAALASVPMFALVALFGGPQRGTTTYRAALLWIGVDIAALSAIAYLAARAGVFAGEATSVALARGFGELSSQQRAWVALFLAGPGLLRFSAGPFSVWLQSFLDEAPVSAGILVSMGTAPLGALLLLDVAVAAAPGGLHALLAPIAWVAAGAALLAGVIVLAERDLRRAAAQLTFLASATAVPALVSTGGQALGAGVIHVVFAGCALTLLLGATEAIERRYETRDATGLVGLSTSAPLLAAALSLGLLGLVGLPAVGAGSSAWLAIAGAVMAHDVEASQMLALGAVFALAHVLAAVGAIALLRKPFSPPTARGRRDVVRVTFAQGLRLLVPTVLTLACGLGATTLLALTDGAARDRSALVERAAQSEAP